MLKFWHIVVFIVIIIVALVHAQVTAPATITSGGGCEHALDIVVPGVNNLDGARGDLAAKVEKLHPDIILVDLELTEEGARCGASTAVEDVKAATQHGSARDLAEPPAHYVPSLVKKHGDDSVCQYIYFAELARAVICSSTPPELSLYEATDVEAARPEFHQRLDSVYMSHGLNYSRNQRDACLEWARKKYTDNYILGLGRPAYARGGKPLPGGNPPQKVAYTLYHLRLATMIRRVREELDAGRTVMCIVAGYYAVDLQRQFRTQK